MRFRLSSLLILRGLSVLGCSVLISACGVPSAQAQTDTTAPTGTIDTPTLNAHFNTGTFPTFTGISGTATDTESNISKVEVNIYRDWGGGREYWNWVTSSWSTSTANTNKVATLGADNATTPGLNRPWSVAFTPTSTQMPPGIYVCTASITNGVNLKYLVNYRSFYIGNDTVAPTITVTTPPAPPATVATLTNISGTVTDSGDSGLAPLRMYGRLTRTWLGSTQYWNNTSNSWGAASVDLPVSVDTNNNTWTIADANLPDNPESGQYRVTVVAYDKAANPTTLNQFFGVTPNDTGAPIATLTYPPQSTSGNVPQLARLSRVTGTATDTAGTGSNEGASGVARVDVQLKRASDNTYWNGSAWVAVTTVYLTERTEVSWIRNTSLPNLSGAPGTYNLIIKAYDHYNNVSGTLNSTFTIAANRLPVAGAQTLSTGYNTPLNVDLVASDADLDDLTYQVASNPTHGTLSGTAPHLVYTPASNWQGSDSFTFTASDPDGTSSAATVTITTLAPVVIDATVGLLADTTWIGTNIVNSTGTNQSRTGNIYVGGTATYKVALRKSGGAGSETVKVTMPNASSFPSGWGLHFYDSTSGGNDITSQVLGAGYPVVVTDTQTTILRFEVTPPTSAAQGASAIVQVRATQNTTSEVAASDTVQGTTAARQIAQPDLLIARCDASGTVQGTWAGLDEYYPATLQILGDDMVAGQTHYFRVKIRNTGTQATLFSLSVPARPTGWTTRILNLNGTGGSTVSTWNTPVVAAGGYYENLIEVKTDGVAGASSSYAMNVRVVSDTLQDQVNVTQTLRDASNSPLDASIQSLNETTFTGEGIINVTGANQQVTLEGLPSAALEFRVKLKNLAASPTDYHITAKKVTDVIPVPSTDWDVKYYDASGSDITADVSSAAGWPVSLTSQGTATDSITVRIKMTAPSAIPTAPTSPDLSVLLQAGVDGDTTSVDVVKATAIVSNNVLPDLSVRLLSQYDPNAPWAGETLIGLSGGQTMAGQKLSNAVMKGAKSSYAVRLKNPNALDGSFKLSLPAAPSGWTVELFQNVDSNFGGGTLVTFDAQTGGPTLLVSAGTFKDLRIDITSAATVSLEYEAQLRASSSPQKLDQISVLPQIQKMAKLEWSYDSAGPWYDFNPANPPEIERLTTIGVRAKKSAENLPWPSPRSMGPKWVWQGETFEGETLWLQGKDVTPALGQSVTAEYGDVISSPIRVLPIYDTTLRADETMVLAGAGPTSLKTVNLSAQVFDEDGVPQANVKVRFRALNNSNMVTGEVGTSLPADDFVVTDSQGIATAVWTSGSDVGDIELEANALDEKGRTRGEAATLSITADNPDVDLTYGEWTQDTGTGGLFRSVTVSAWSLGQNIPGRSVTLSSQVKDYATNQPVTGYSASFGTGTPSTTITGTTNADGEFTTVQYWNPGNVGDLPQDYDIIVDASAS